jgi:hypothetical protein
VQAAVAQLAVVERGLLRPLAGDVADAGEFLALVLVLLDLRLMISAVSRFLCR